MPPKKKGGKKGEDSKKPPAFQKSVAVCTAQGPGPKYKLKSLVGYNDHCASRYRNPAYSIAAKQTGADMAKDGPGPIYYVNLPRADGFTIGNALRGGTTNCGPGPYALPDPPRTPAFSIKWRTELRGGGISAGPYNLPDERSGPAFTIGLKPTGDRCSGGPGPAPPYSIDVIKPRAPAFSLGHKQTDSGICGSPGPYDPYVGPKTPAYSFGVKLNPCLSPFLTECDKMC